MPPHKFRVNRDTPAYYLTAVTKDRLPVFRTATIAKIVCSALNDARRSGGFLIFAYVVMLDHLHLVTDSSVKASQIHRFVNGNIARQVIDHLKSEGHNDALKKLAAVGRRDGSEYSLWNHNPDTRLLWTDQMLWQRIQYTHLNPVRAGLCDHPDDWPWSSARIIHRRTRENEPLDVDFGRIEWSWR